MELIWLLIKASAWQVAIAIFTGLVSGGCSAQLIALINRAVSDNNRSQLLPLFLGLAVVVLVTGILSQFLLVKLAQDAVYKLRLQMSRGILASPLRNLEKLGANRLLATLTDDVQSISNTIFVIPFLCVDIAIIIGCLFYLGYLSGAVFGVTVLFMGIAIGSVQFFLNRARDYLIAAREEEDRLFKHFRSITDGIKELKLHAKRRQEFVNYELETSVQNSRLQNIAALNTFAIASTWGNLLYFAILGCLIFGLSQFINLTPALLSSYVITLTYLTTPFQNLLQRLPLLFRANVALKKVETMGLSLANQKELTAEIPPIPTANWTKLELDQVIHTYPGEQEDQQFKLGAMNLSFHPGELVFIIGGNGSGKSTLGKILTGLYLPDQGEIRFNGEPITEQNLEWYRQHFSVIFSDFYLFEKLLGMEHHDIDQQARTYLKELQLDYKVEVKNGVLSTTNLSQGQRKRLALLTAYLEDRPIYLFDEWAADQDPIFREIFYTELLPELKKRGKTIFVISHDDHYFHICDRAIKLDYGQVEYDRLNTQSPES